MNKIYRALSDPTRRRVLALLRERDMTAGELAGHFELAAPTMSGHFAVLNDAGLIQADRAGTTITYRLNVSVLEEAMMALMDAFKLDPAGPADEPPATRDRRGGGGRDHVRPGGMGLGRRSPPVPRSRSTGASTASPTATPRRRSLSCSPRCSASGWWLMLYFLPRFEPRRPEPGRVRSGLPARSRSPCSS